jgi:hypothetical protein
MQELAQLGGTGNKAMAYAVPSDVDLAIVLDLHRWVLHTMLLQATTHNGQT